ncbi:hypothetical protein SIXOD_v1c19280 [Spiroplasma ixodetis Y32]|nr:hypothetical protein SIXOD_v1c19280 [Spiroplasma ixodetis Y32]
MNTQKVLNKSLKQKNKAAKNRLRRTGVTLDLIILAQ